jgi:hypothetical protein
VGKVDTKTAPKQRSTLGQIHCSQLPTTNRKSKLNHFSRWPTGSFRSDRIGRYYPPNASSLLVGCPHNAPSGFRMTHGSLLFRLQRGCTMWAVILPYQLTDSLLFHVAARMGSGHASILCNMHCRYITEIVPAWNLPISTVR